MTADQWAGLSLAELLVAREALDAKIQAMRSEARDAAIAQIRELMATYGLSQADVMLGAAAAARSRKIEPRKKATARYYDPNSGKTWTGRGKAPRWIAGQDYTNFLIPAEGILRKMAQQAPAGA